MSSDTETETAQPPGKLFGGYHGLPEIYDEMAAGPRRLRPHWLKFAESIERLGREELAARWENARRMIREHGVTYNVYGDPQGMDRPWELDMLPLLISQAEWRVIEAGLVQRTKLFNLVLADLYGPQRLVREGHLPPSLLFANPGFLRPCHGLPIPRLVYLHVHAADLARAPNGQWWVLADRTQAPSGAGYALESRIVMARTFHDQFRDCQVHRLAGFFRFLRDTLRALAPQRQENPTVVLLTPGPYNETYFEHAYLARYLGFTLVEGGDLAVRDRRVFIKTLTGLQPVDVILRRVDDTFCDPLELRADSFLGVPGLLEACRAGHVAIANALGAGLIESPAFLAFLPGLSRLLLGEDLKLPSVATWWCGHSSERQYVLENLPEMVIKPAFASGNQEIFFGETMTAQERARLIEAIQLRPHRYVGQEQVALSTAPVWLNGEPEPRPVVVRAYVASDGDASVVMPGGLGRVSINAEDPVVSMQSGGGSKDTWVLSDGPVSTFTLLTPSGQRSPLGGPISEMPSRVADQFYWLGRYAERLEHTARVLRCVGIRVVDEAGAEWPPELAAVVQLLVALELLPKRFLAPAPLRDLEQELVNLITKPDQTGSAREILIRVRAIASVVRDRCSVDTWSILNQLQVEVSSRPRALSMPDLLASLNTLIVDLSAFSGMEMENMTRGLGWRFLDFGRRLERSVRLVAMLRATLSPMVKSASVLEPVLEVADSVMTYRRRYFAGVRLPGVLELLLADESNPRALAFQLEALADHAAHLPQDAGAPAGGKEQAHTATLRERLRQADLKELADAHDQGQLEPLNALLSDFELELGLLSNQLTHHYFSHTVARVS